MYEQPKDERGSGGLLTAIITIVIVIALIFGFRWCVKQGGTKEVPQPPKTELTADPDDLLFQPILKETKEEGSPTPAVREGLPLQQPDGEDSSSEELPEDADPVPPPP